MKRGTEAAPLSGAEALEQTDAVHARHVDITDCHQDVRCGSQDRGASCCSTRCGSRALGLQHRTHPQHHRGPRRHQDGPSSPAFILDVPTGFLASRKFEARCAKRHRDMATTACGGSSRCGSVGRRQGSWRTTADSSPDLPRIFRPRFAQTLADRAILTRLYTQGPVRARRRSGKETTHVRPLRRNRNCWTLPARGGRRPGRWSRVGIRDRDDRRSPNTPRPATNERRLSAKIGVLALRHVGGATADLISVRASGS